MCGETSGRFRSLLIRLKSGDRAARDELIDLTADRLRTLASRMFRDDDRLRRWADSGDVFANASIRLWHSLRKVRPESEREFFALAALHIRRELINLSRGVFGPNGIGSHHDSSPNLASSERIHPSDTDEDPAEREWWCRFHQAIERLDETDREIVGLIYYNGWTYPEVAKLVGVSVKTVARRWVAAMARVRGVVGPGSSRRDD